MEKCQEIVTPASGMTLPEEWLKIRGPVPYVRWNMRKNYGVFGALWSWRFRQSNLPREFCFALSVPRDAEL